MYNIEFTTPEAKLESLAALVTHRLRNIVAIFLMAAKEEHFSELHSRYLMNAMKSLSRKGHFLNRLLNGITTLNNSEIAIKEVSWFEALYSPFVRALSRLEVDVPSQFYLHEQVKYVVIPTRISTTTYKIVEKLTVEDKSLRILDELIVPHFDSPPIIHSNRLRYDKREERILVI